MHCRAGSWAVRVGDTNGFETNEMKTPQNICEKTLKDKIISKR